MSLWLCTKARVFFFTVNCSAGFQGDTDKMGCVPCPEGTFKRKKSIDDCKTCKANNRTTTLVDGAYKISHCKGK